jgi:hypothetical protein
MSAGTPPAVRLAVKGVGPKLFHSAATQRARKKFGTQVAA